MLGSFILGDFVRTFSEVLSSNSSSEISERFCVLVLVTLDSEDTSPISLFELYLPTE